MTIRESEGSERGGIWGLRIEIESSSGHMQSEIDRAVGWIK